MGIEQNAAGDSPQISPLAYVHPTAVLIGNVQVHDKVFIGPHAVIRADEPGEGGAVTPVIIGEGSNVQDCAVIHALGGTGVTLGPGTSVAHGAIVHGPCQIGADCVVGFGSVVFNSTLGDGVIVMHRALVEAVEVPSNLFIPSSTALTDPSDVRHLQTAQPDMVAFAQKIRQTNMYLAEAALSKN